MSDSIRQEALQILDSLAFTAFERCQRLSRGFDTIPSKIGLYAFRHRTEGLLDIGKAKSLRDRLRGGHKATIEMAISSFLDEESLSFEDCLLAKRLEGSGSNHH